MNIKEIDFGNDSKNEEVKQFIEKHVTLNNEVEQVILSINDKEIHLTDDGNLFIENEITLNNEVKNFETTIGTNHINIENINTNGFSVNIDDQGITVKFNGRKIEIFPTGEIMSMNFNSINDELSIKDNNITIKEK